MLLKYFGRYIGVTNVPCNSVRISGDEDDLKTFSNLIKEKGIAIEDDFDDDPSRQGIIFFTVIFCLALMIGVSVYFIHYFGLNQ